MTEKRFKHKYNMLGMQFICYDDKDILLGAFADSDGVEHIVDKLNKLNEENEQLKSRVEYLERKIDRERTSYQKQHEKWEEEIQKENEQLKQQMQRLYNYFEDWYRDMTSANDFSEIWDNVKEDERWGDVE